MLNRRGFISSAAAALPYLLLRNGQGEVADIRSFIGGDGDITFALEELRRLNIGRAWLAAGRYTVDAGTKIGDLELIGNGEATVVEPRGRRSPYLLQSEGSTTDLPRLAGPIHEGAESIQLTARPDCLPGDLVLLFDPRPFSFSSVRSEYKEGAFSVVEFVEGARIHFREPIACSLDVEHGRAALVKPKRPKIRNLRFECDNIGALRVGLSSEATLENLAVRNASAHGIYVDRSHRFSLVDLNIANAGATSGSDYGLAIGNSHSGRVSGGNFHGRRHGIAIGGGNFDAAIPNRFIEISGARISNEKRSGVHAADMHGNCSDVSYRACRVEGGAALGGRGGAYIDCEIEAMNNGVCVAGVEILGGLQMLDRCQLSSMSDASRGYRGIIDFGGNSEAIGSHTREPVQIVIRDTHVTATNQGEKSRIVELRDRGAQVAVDLLIANLAYEVNRLGAVISLRAYPRGPWRGEIEISEIKGNRPAPSVITH